MRLFYFPFLSFRLVARGIACFVVVAPTTTLGVVFASGYSFFERTVDVGRLHVRRDRAPCGDEVQGDKQALGTRRNEAEGTKEHVSVPTDARDG